ncbi:MAG: hypothetical protein IAG13_01915 [Deltaproteobacteria bacterium]|nr:hypothetical protein [Nannocystaceae bacterium]
MLRTPRDPQPTTSLRHRPFVTACIAGAALGLAAACAPKADVADCSETKPCGRGEICDLEVNECIDAGLEVENTENPAPMTFSAKPVPFFRGRVCTVHEVQAGAAIPIRLDPCLHSCIDSNSFHHKHYYSCVGTRCEAWAMMYVDAASVAEGCPADAFAKFDPAECVYKDDEAVDFSITVTVDEEPVQGSVSLEVPFLNNLDTAAIAADFDNTDLIREKIEQYPQDEARIVGGKPITLSAASPAPPASCAGGACPCYDVGF